MVAAVAANNCGFPLIRVWILLEVFGTCSCPAAVPAAAGSGGRRGEVTPTFLLLPLPPARRENLFETLLDTSLLLWMLLPAAVPAIAAAAALNAAVLILTRACSGRWSRNFFNKSSG
jgi:hypothetical protein